MLPTAREIHNRGRTLKVISQFWSKRQRVGLWCESVPEFEYCFHLELDATVVSFRTQPCTIAYEFEGERHRHTPDFEVQRAHVLRRHFVNVKPQSVADYHGFIARADAIAQSLAGLDSTHEVVTAEQIGIHPRLPNLKLLYLHLDRTLTPSLLDTVTRHMQIHQDATAAVVRDLIRPFGDIGLVWALVARGHLSANLDLPLNNQAVLSMER